MWRTRMGPKLIFFAQVLVRLVGADDHVYPNFIDVMQWLAESNLLEMIVDKLSPSVSGIFAFCVYSLSVRCCWLAVCCIYTLLKPNLRKCTMFCRMLVYSFISRWSIGYSLTYFYEALLLNLGCFYKCECMIWPAENIFGLDNNFVRNAVTTQSALWCWVCCYGVT